MRICSHCGEVVLALEVLRYDTSDRPVAQQMIPKYCPFCACKYIVDDIPLKKEDKNRG